MLRSSTNRKWVYDVVAFYAVSSPQKHALVNVAYAGTGPTETFESRLHAKISAVFIHD